MSRQELMFLNVQPVLVYTTSLFYKLLMHLLVKDTSLLIEWFIYVDFDLKILLGSRI